MATHACSMLSSLARTQRSSGTSASLSRATCSPLDQVQPIWCGHGTWLPPQCTCLVRLIMSVSPGLVLECYVCHIIYTLCLCTGISKHRILQGSGSSAMQGHSLQLPQTHSHAMCAGLHKVIRMRVVAPMPVTERSLGREVSGIPAHYPPGSATSTAAFPGPARSVTAQSPPAELPQEPLQSV